MDTRHINVPENNNQNAHQLLYIEYFYLVHFPFSLLVQSPSFGVHSWIDATDCYYFTSTSAFHRIIFAIPICRRHVRNKGISFWLCLYEKKNLLNCMRHDKRFSNFIPYRIDWKIIFIHYILIIFSSWRQLPLENK